MSLQVRSMTPHDVSAVVEVHLASFPTFFLSFLGPRFLRQLYAGIVEDESGVAFVAEEEGTVVGFVAGTTAPAGLYGRLLKRRVVRFAFAALPAFLRRPSIGARLLRALRKPAEAGREQQGIAELMSLGVDPARQGSGAGAALAERFVEAASRAGAAAVHLTTDADANEAVNRFYERRGFVVLRSFVTPEGRRMNEYARTCGR